MSDIYLIPKTIPCPSCYRKWDYSYLLNAIACTKDKEFVCVCGAAITVQHVGKFTGKIVNIKEVG